METRALAVQDWSGPSSHPIADQPACGALPGASLMPWRVPPQVREALRVATALAECRHDPDHAAYAEALH